MEKITLNYSVSGQKLKPLYSLKKFASDTVNYVEAVFDLDESWAFDSVRAVWKTENACISTVLDQDGACTVPQEVLQKKAKVEVNLVGSDVEENLLTDRLTTYPVQAFIVDRDVPICGSETAEITPSQFEQFVQIVTAEVAKIRDVDRVELNDDYTITFYYSDGTESPKIGPIRGETGADGNGIQSITKIGSEGRIDTYRIAYTNGGHFDFNVTNGEKGDRGEQGETGNGIDRIEKTATVGSVDTYTIYFTDGTTTTFTVTNGEVTKAELETLLPTESASGSIVSFPDGQSVFPMKSLKVNLEPIQDLSNGDPSHSNICPIYGHDSVGATRAGKNILPLPTLQGYWAISDGSFGSSGQWVSCQKIKVNPNTQYHLSSTFVTRWCGVCAYDANGSYLGGIGETAQSADHAIDLTITTPSNCAYIGVSMANPNSGSQTIRPSYVSDLQLKLGSTATDYEPYEGDTYTADLGQTVYGGTVDLVSGVLTVDRAMVTLNTANMDNSEESPGWRNSGIRSLIGSGLNNGFNDVQTNVGRGIGVNTIGTNDILMLLTVQYGLTQSEWKSLSVDVQIIAPLATPQEIQLTPQVIATLRGQNNVWSEQGDVDVTYKADIQLYTDKKTNELAVAIAAL